MVVTSVQLLALPQLLLDQGELPLQEILLLGDQVEVQLQAAHTLQLLQTHPASPPDTHTIEDEAATDVNLKIQKYTTRHSYSGNSSAEIPRGKYN